MANTMVNPSCSNICPDRPFIVASGRYTTMVVIVEAIIEAVTSFVPSKAACFRSGVLFCLLKQLSITTMEESTIIPMAMTREPSVTMFMENPIILIRIRVRNREMGMEAPTIRLALKSPKNRKIMIMEMTTAITMVSATSLRESRMESASSRATVMVRFSSSPSRLLMTCLTCLERSMAVLLCCLVKEMEMVSSPL